MFCRFGRNFYDGAALGIFLGDRILRDAIQRILNIEREQKRRYDNNALARYNTDKVHAKQMEFHRCDKRNRWVFGGNRTGKTE